MERMGQVNSLSKQEEIKHCTICNKDICKCPTIDRGSFAKYVKRDEIREGLQLIISRWYANQGNRIITQPVEDELLKYLHDNDVVLRVKKPLPEEIEDEEYTGCDWVNRKLVIQHCPLLSAGYEATESLIEEEK